MCSPASLLYTLSVVSLQTWTLSGAGPLLPGPALHTIMFAKDAYLLPSFILFDDNSSETYWAVRAALCIGCWLKVWLVQLPAAQGEKEVDVQSENKHTHVSVCFFLGTILLLCAG